VLAADRDIQLFEAEVILDRLPFNFESVDFFRDEGFGVHGLPHYAKADLGDRFIFECGHSVMPAEHYRRLDKMKDPRNVVFSAYRSHPANPRYPVHLGRGGRVVSGSNGARSGFALAHPFVIDHRYIELISRCKFSIVEIIDYCIRKEILRFVPSSTPPEFDIVEEMDMLLPIYEEAVAPLASSHS
jgi:hypothetical protein